MLNKLVSALLNAIFPWDVACPVCCRYLVGTEHIICCHCEADLLRNALTPLEQISAHAPLLRCISAFTYDGVARFLVRRLKYHSDGTIAFLLAPHMLSALLKVFPRPMWDAVVPVPMHPAKEAVRGYNQAILLAEQIAFHLSLPLRTDLLHRTRDIASQTKRTAQQRRLAMEGVFTADRKEPGLRILLVDDVLTTGATATACANALLASGAASVTLLTACQA